MGRIVLVGYKPKPGKESELEALMKTHLPILREEGLVTDRESQRGNRVGTHEFESPGNVASLFFCL